MKQILIRSYAKINLSIDVKGIMEDGFHQVEMIMQQIDLFDSVRIKWYPREKSEQSGFNIVLRTNKYYLPNDSRNLAYRAAELMIERYGQRFGGGSIAIDIKKVIPVAAGLAGGSGNGAAVLLGLNKLWGIGLSVEQLCELGKRLGSDVPFCIMGQAKANNCLGDTINNDPQAITCGIATGTGTDIKSCKPLDSFMVLIKPPIGVSTKEVYKGIDKCVISKHPNTIKLVDGLEKRNYNIIYREMINVLEEYTLKAYPIVHKAKEQLAKNTEAEIVLMSGSGPTVFALYKNRYQAVNACKKMRQAGYEAYWAKTIK